MGQASSKDEMLYSQVGAGNVEAIKALCREGASLEWIDKEGKTPLIVACMNPELFDVARTLIELGANVNAYRPGRQAGTPLHHAAKRGLDHTVRLLLSHGANAIARNDDCHSPLEVARLKGHTNVVRAIENHICHFSGWLRESYGPGFLEAFVPQLWSRKIWAVVVPCGSHDPTKPRKLQLVIYPTLQDAQPRTVIALWKAKIEEPKLHQPDPTLIIYDYTKIRYKLASGNEGDKQQFQWLYNACRGVPQVMAPTVPHDTVPSVPPTMIQTAAEAAELAMGISASIHSTADDRPANLPNTFPVSEAINTNGWGNSADDASHSGWGPAAGSTPSNASSSGWLNEPPNKEYNGWGGSESDPVQSIHTQDSNCSAAHTSSGNPASIALSPSAPPITVEVFDEGPLHYPSIDLSPVEFSAPTTENGAFGRNEANDGVGSSSCIICWEAPIEGACIPCGHMAGCMSCLNDIKAEKGVCPICRANITQIIRIYAV